MEKQFNNDKQKKHFYVVNEEEIKLLQLTSISEKENSPYYYGGSYPYCGYYSGYSGYY